MKISYILSKIIFKKSIGFNILVILLLTVSMYTLASTITANKGAGVLLDAVQDKKNDNVVYCYEGGDVDAFMQGLEGFIGFEYVYRTYAGNQIRPTENSAPLRIVNVIYYYSDYFADIKMPLVKGKWFTDAVVEEGFIGMVVTDGFGYKIGDIIESKYQDGTVLQFQITGILPEKSYYLTLEGFSTPTTLDNMFSTAPTLPKEYSTIFPPEVVCICQADDRIKNGFSNSVAVFDSSLSDEEMARNLEAIKAYTQDVVTLKEMYGVTKYYVETERQMYMPIFVSFALLSMASFFTIAFSSFDKSWRATEAARLAGADRRIIALGNCLYFAYLLLPATVLYALLTATNFNLLASMESYVVQTATYVLIPIFYAIVMLGLGAVISVAFAKNKIKTQ